MADSKMTSSPTRTSLVAAEAARTDARAPTIVVKTMMRTWGPMVADEFKTAEGWWKATVKDGEHCFMFSKSDPNPAFFNGEWKNGVTAALTKAGFELTSGKKLKEAGEISPEKFDELPKVNKTAPQWWRKEEDGWKPKSKWTPNMVTFVNARGSDATFQKKLDAKAPSVPRTRKEDVETETETKGKTKAKPAAKGKGKGKGKPAAKGKTETKTKTKTKGKGKAKPAAKKRTLENPSPPQPAKKTKNGKKKRA